jgi:hypothetical protein
MNPFYKTTFSIPILRQRPAKYYKDPRPSRVSNKNAIQEEVDL